MNLSIFCKHKYLHKTEKKVGVRETVYWFV